jgi:hypothetical protein
MPEVYVTWVDSTLDLELPLAMRARYNKPPARHWNTESAFAIVTDDDHPVRVRPRFFPCGACGEKSAFHSRGQIIFRLNVKRGPAPITYQYGLALRDGKNRNEEDREILPEGVLPHVGQELASGALPPQIQPIFHRRLNHFGSEYDEHIRPPKFCALPGSIPPRKYPTDTLSPYITCVYGRRIIQYPS